MTELPVTRSTVRGRLILGFILTVLFTLLLISRLAWIQIVQADELYEQAWKQWNHNLPISTSRGSIYDRSGTLMAGSMQADTIGAIPMQLEDPLAAAAALSPILEIEIETLYELLLLDRSAVYLKRKVEPEVSEAIRQLNIPGIVFFREEKRYYPNDDLAAQLLGVAGMDEGLSGLEAYYEDLLSGSAGRIYYPADARGRQLPHDFTRYIQPQEGLDLYLTIDQSIQHIVERELDRIMVEAAPRQAMAVAVNPHTGAVMAAASRPGFDPSQFSLYDPDSWTPAPFTSSFEPGSTFKMIILAAMIEEGLFHPEEEHHCPGYIVVNGRRINCWTVDRGGHGTITSHDSVGGSCNPVFITLGNRLGADKMFQYVRAFGFGAPSGIDYPGESSGMIFSPSAVGPLELATTSFGQGISVTPLQQVMAIAAIANGGYLYSPYLVEQVRSQDGETVYSHEAEPVRQVIAEDTAREVALLMESVLITGTGQNAALEGYRAAGKTGTAEKIGEDGLYRSDEFIYSLVGFAPLENPRIALYVAVDGVTKGPRFGSYTSAPMFKRIMEESLNYLLVAPTEFEDTGEEE